MHSKYKCQHLVCIGDSNTYGFDPRSYVGGRYPRESLWVNILASLSGWVTHNAGENGRRIPCCEYEVAVLKEQLETCAPYDQDLIMLGSNDLLNGLSPERIAERMKWFLDRLPVDASHIILLPPPAFRPGTWIQDPLCFEANRKLANLIGEIAKGRGMLFLDTSSWEIPIAFDGVHFLEDGHRVFAQQLWNALQMQTSP